MPPGKSDLKFAFIWLFRTQYGYYLTGTNDVYMGINSHICIQIVPPKLVGGFRGAKPPESTFAPPYKFKRIFDLTVDCQLNGKWELGIGSLLLIH